MLLEKLQAKKNGFVGQKESGKTTKTSATVVMTTEFEAAKEDYEKMVLHYRLAARHVSKGTKYGVSGTVHMAKAATAAPGAATEVMAKKVNDYIFTFEAWKARGNVRRYFELQSIFERNALRGPAIKRLLPLGAKEMVAKTTAPSQAVKAWELLCSKYGVEGATNWIQQNPEMWEMMKGSDK